MGLYVTAAEAYKKWRAAPDEVKLLDVRTPEEFLFVGHPEMAQCIPLGFQSYRWDDQKGYFDLDVNPEFLNQVKEWFDPGDTILVMCRSGGPQRDSRKPAGEGRLHRCLEHHRWHGR